MHYLKQILHQAEQTFLREVITDYHLADDIYEICTRHGNDIFLVADENTAKLLNKNVFNKISHLIIPAPPVIPVSRAGMTPGGEMTPSRAASLETVNLVRNKVKDSDLIVAFGSGTVNDICKYASYLEKKDYISFPTAASMNGYTSANASILVNGYKKSFKAHLPRAVYIDIDILVNAPLRLTLSGFADFICRSTVQADWLLSHLLLGTEYNELPFTLVRDLEQILLREYTALTKRSRKVVLLLMEVLLISGLGMVISKGSYSASQGEHMIAHAMEMVTRDHSLLHGEKIAVTTITMANLQEKILSIQNPIIKPTTLDVEHITQCFDNIEFVRTFEQKQIMQQKIQEIICKEWHNISSLIKQNLLPAKHLQKIFEDLSIPHLPEHLSWNKEQYCKVVDLAFTTRDRFTFLDLANCIEES
ncbi:iron-containing alcohol dehydrogenase [Wolbachia pipientis]|uniref:iron-containing alcohol dehydrogenase n=1 Tax=Wolbachia TaxID=953 RepID=UPI00019864BD|nr:MULTISPECIES: iron-containing alcohol dehydrogenase [Wolbachia]MDX5488241.1 iron-containing alcohol dehydrogenase [Wolbachia endosymbiont of Andrena praecox]MDX5497638.1 iron-containing alcohol dehydrogenase [Wolbachia endosymbiont of Lasioglossum nitidulum]MDX5510018.1 iron-containing alcohol dehydrogenase [Wolbachia endosymbiont of Lasioglossum morio]MDX5543717.1 iron-containing alcohol dehydrogenase [Wolbachia endosymbiont of Andrena apicata]MDX5561785.1 iron-containing alcohol dehydroge